MSYMLRVSGIFIECMCICSKSLLVFKFFNWKIPYEAWKVSYAAQCQYRSRELLHNSVGLYFESPVYLMLRNQYFLIDLNEQ